jgi:phage baseplate assembly protein W
MSEEFKGSGWAFPLRPDLGGGLGYTGVDANIEQSLGERVMRPGFGTKARDLVFAPGSTQHLGLLEATVGEAIRDFEPRVVAEQVVAELDPRDETRAVVDVTYRILRSNARDNLVFPFYLGTLGLEASP